MKTEFWGYPKRYLRLTAETGADGLALAKIHARGVGKLETDNSTVRLSVLFSEGEG